MHDLHLDSQFTLERSHWISGHLPGIIRGTKLWVVIYSVRLP